MTQTIAFRLPIPDYLQVVQLAQQHGERLSDVMRTLVSRALEAEEGKLSGPEGGRDNPGRVPGRNS